MKIIFINRFFYPDISATSQMLSDQAFALARDGHEVTVIAAQQSYANASERLPASEVIDGVQIHRVWTSSFGRHRLRGRALDYASFFVTACAKLLSLVRRGDIVVTKTDPPMLSVLTTPLCAVRGAKSVNWLQDIFPEAAERLGIGHGRAARVCHAALRAARNFSLRRADQNVVIGRVMRRQVEGLGVEASRITVIPNWADGSVIRPVTKDANALRNEWGLGKHFVVAHSGNLGRAHDYRLFLEAMGLVEKEASGVAPQLELATGGAPASAPEQSTSVRWLFIGGGVSFAGLEAGAADRQLKTVDFKPYQPRERLAESLSVADAHLVTLRPELEGLIVPSKVYGCMAAGRPIIFVGAKDGEVARLVRDHRCGLVVAPDDARALADAIGELAASPERAAWMGRNARRAFERSYDVRHAQGRWRRLIRELAQGEAVAKPVTDMPRNEEGLRPALARRFLGR